MTDDLEPGRRAGQRRSTWRRLAPQAMVTRSPSSSSKLSSTRTITDRGQLSPAVYSLNEQEVEKQDALISFILDGDVKGTLVSCHSWYTQYLQTQFKSHWHQLTTALSDLDENSPYPKPGELATVYDYCLMVTKLLKNQRDLSLVEIVDELDNEGMLKLQLDEERAVPNQIVFSAVGWLTMLYQAVPRPKLDKLEVTETSTSAYGMRNALNTRKYYTYRLGFDYIDLPLHNLFNRFGDLIPEAKGLIFCEPAANRGGTPESISVPSVCFQALHEFAELNIEWVTSLNLHLELDSSRKTLKIFQFPSFCRLMTVEKKNNILSRLFNDHSARHCEDVAKPDIPIERYFQEFLLTYRLLFGQDARSRSIFRQVVPTFDEQRSTTTDGFAWDHDPLVRILCSTNCTEGQAGKLYEELRCGEPARYYDPLEFPFFGNKLLELQKLVNEQPAPNLMSLVRDRRNIGSWWAMQTNHILMVFATITILLMVLGLAFQIWQVELAKEQLRQGHP